MGALLAVRFPLRRCKTRNPDLETDVVVYEPVSDRVACRRKALGATTLVSTTSAANRSDFGELPSRDGRLANGVRYPS